ncbi:keratin-associated protein 20-3-like [Mesoplodon densirostris]|nr:keratin-associated protein 20-3-like [Mesoplodon densirostris]
MYYYRNYYGGLGYYGYSCGYGYVCCFGAFRILECGYRCGCNRYGLDC